MPLPIHRQITLRLKARTVSRSYFSNISGKATQCCWPGSWPWQSNNRHMMTNNTRPYSLLATTTLVPAAHSPFLWRILSEIIRNPDTSRFGVSILPMAFWLGQNAQDMRRNSCHRIDICRWEEHRPRIERENS